MRKLWLLITASLFVSACGGSGIVQSVLPGELKPKVGETVIFKMSREGFGEGTVESVEGNKYHIKYGVTSETKDQSDVYALPKGNANRELKPGDIVVAKMESGLFWAGAEVLNAGPDVIEVKEIWRGGTANLPTEKILVPRPDAVAELQKLKAEKEFTKKATTGQPRPPAGYAPKAGERVVALWGTNSWYDGEIVSISGSKAKIKWQSFNESELNFDKIIPYPKPETSTMPAANSYVLVKTDNSSQRWDPAQVTSVDGNSAEVKFANGKTRSIKADEYIASN